MSGRRVVLAAVKCPLSRYRRIRRGQDRVPAGDLPPPGLIGTRGHPELVDDSQAGYSCYDNGTAVAAEAFICVEERDSNPPSVSPLSRHLASPPAGLVSGASMVPAIPLSIRS